MPESKNRFRITSIVIAVVMLVGFLGVLIGPTTINVSATITGNTYSGSGDWAITSNTVYTGETLIVYGNISVLGPYTLTLSSTHLTVNCPAGGAQVRYINLTGPPHTGGLIVTAGSTIDTTNATPGIYNLKIDVIGTTYVHYDNSTLKNAIVNLDGHETPSHFSNNTIQASVFLKPVSGGVVYPRPVSWAYNTIEDVNGYVSVIDLASHNSVNHCTFSDITPPTIPIWIVAQNNVSVRYCQFDESIYNRITIAPISTAYANDLNISYNSFGVTGNTLVNASNAINIAGLGLRSHCDHNTFETIRNGSNGIYAPPQGGWSLIGNAFDLVDASGLVATGTTNGIFLEPGIGLGPVKQILDTRVDGVVGPPTDIGSTGNGIMCYLSGNFTVQDSVIQNVTSISNGISIFGGGGTNILIQNNYIADIDVSSNAIGVYGGHGVIVRNNTIHDLKVGCGVGVANIGIGQLIRDNRVTGLQDADRAGVYVVSGEVWGIQGATFINNTVSGVPNSIDIASPTYWIGGTLPTSVTIDTPENALVRCANANLTIRHNGYEVLQLANGATYYNLTYYANGTASRSFPRTDTTVRFFNITYTQLSIVTDSPVTITCTGDNMNWLANGTASLTVTFTLSGLESGRMYRLYIDGNQDALLTASGSGTISFTYSGPWSEHQFEIVATSISGSISPLVNLIFIMFAIGVVVGVIVEGTYSLRKNKMLSSEQMMKSLVNMVIYIIIGIAGVGILYSIVV